jgi:single-strand DNA-binding protein
MSFEIEGKLYRKFPTENKTGTFQAREFVIETESGNYPQLIKFQLVQDKCSLLDDYQEGEAIKVYFDLRGREWNDKFFTNLNAWRLDRPKDKPAQAAAPQAGEPDNFPSTRDEPKADLDNDLPF